ncbi:MAG: biopolymer transport protein ExbD [Planctomycetota bacterium]
MLRSCLPHALAFVTLLATTAAQSKPLITVEAPQERVTQEKLGGALPAIGSVGNTPTQDTYAIELHQNGMLSVKGIPVTFDECFQQLADYSKDIPGLRIGGLTTSPVNVLIRADRSVPLAAIDRMLRECVRRDISAPRIFFGATHAITKGEGAFAYFLPIDRGSSKAGVEVIPVTATPGKPGTVDGLENYLFRYSSAMEPEQRKQAAVTIETRGDVAWGTALSMLDAAARAGIPVAYLDCRLTAAQCKCWLAEATKRDLRALQLASPATTEVGCQIGPVTVKRGPQQDLPARVQGGFAGYPSSPSGLVIEEIEIEEVTETDMGLLWPGTGLSGGEPGRYGDRRLGGPAKRLRPATSQAIDEGLDWLKQHQDEDGKWDSDGFMKHDKAGTEICDGAGNAVHDVGVTGLALLAMMGGGSTMRSGPYRNQIKLAVKWLRLQQHHNGRFGSNASHDFVYDHAIATYAIVEAYGLSDYKLIKPVAQKAINYLESHRNPYSVWRYQPRDGDNDTSVTNWCALAYIAGSHFNLQVNKSALQVVGSWLDEISDPATGLHGYSKRGEPSSRHPGDHATRFPLAQNEALTGASLFVRFMLGQTMEKNPIMRKAAGRVHSLPPAWTPKAGNIDFYAWYWCSQAMHQVGGQHWQNWSNSLTEALLTGQNTKGAAKGSWAPIGVWGEDGGRIASTALATLSLQSHYRYRRLVR